MKRIIQGVVWAVLLGSLTIQADPFKTWTWTEPTQYENGNPIHSTDTITYTLYCNDTSGEQGEPYEIAIALDDPGAPPSIEDMAPVVRGRAGTYYCVATAASFAFNTESAFSAETNFIVTAASIGNVPRPPTNLTFQ